MKGGQRRAKSKPAAVARRRSVAWPAQLASDVSIAKVVIAGRRAPPAFGNVVARLSDSTEWRLADRALSVLGDARARRDPALALARSRAAERTDGAAEAGEWLALAQTLVDARTPVLAARIVFRLVVWHLRRAEVPATRTLWRPDGISSPLPRTRLATFFTLRRWWRMRKANGDARRTCISVRSPGPRRR